ncbi:hypothetical protein DMUE_4119 [Dictyocoela muelleri]|nr:hypothetical protein DMUE_4119 [Dictyocoela muelleri]
MKSEKIEKINNSEIFKFVRNIKLNEVLLNMKCAIKKKIPISNLFSSWFTKKDPLDILFSYFPLISVIYSTITFNLIFVFRSISIYFTSLLLKMIFKKERIFKINKTDEKFLIKNFSIDYLKGCIRNIESKYAFPSTHSLFFFVLYKCSPSFLFLLIFLAGTFSRIYYKYHDIDDVLFGIFVGSIFCDLWEKIGLTDC